MNVKIRYLFKDISVLSVVDCSASGGNPCLNGGTCENNACTCAAEFNGALCSTGEKIYSNTRSYCDFNL